MHLQERNFCISKGILESQSPNHDVGAEIGYTGDLLKHTPEQHFRTSNCFTVLLELDEMENDLLVR